MANDSEVRTWPGLTTISAILIEHRLLRELMHAMEEALLAHTPVEPLRGRAAMLEVAIDRHAAREEEQLFAPLRARSQTTRHLIEMMEIVHDEVRGLFEEVQVEPDPISKMWTVLEMTEAHFGREEKELFPLAESLFAEKRVGPD